MQLLKKGLNISSFLFMKIKKYLIGVIVLIGYLLLGEKLHIYIPCFIHRITGFYCPGCGVTRMLLSMLKLDFYRAYLYNKLLFILSPFALFLFLDYIYSMIKNKNPLYKNINNKVWYLLIIILVIYGVLRNIFPSLAPII